jgi:hypothetical protein
MSNEEAVNTLTLKGGSKMKIEKDIIEVIVYFQNAKIEGEIHIPKGGRITDFINIPTKAFIPITNAVFSSLDKQNNYNCEYRAGFMEVNKSFITIVIPKEQAKEHKI